MADNAFPDPPSVQDEKSSEQGDLYEDDSADSDRVIKHSNALKNTSVDATEYVSELENDINIHVDILNATRSGMDKVTTAGLMAAYTFASLMSVEILYARTFDADTAVATWVIFLGELILIITALIIMKIGYSYENDWYFDNLLCVLFGISWFGLLWQVIAWNSGCWAVGYLFSRMPLLLITICYFKQILPYRDAREYIHRFNAIYGLCYVVAPLVTGFIAYFGSYRWVFGLNFALYSLLILFNFRFVVNKYRVLENDQLTLVRPIYERYRLKRHHKNKKSQGDDDDDGDGGDNDNNDNVNTKPKKLGKHASHDSSSVTTDTTDTTDSTIDPMEGSAVNHEIDDDDVSKQWLKSIDFRFPSCIYQSLRRAAIRESKKFYNVDLFLLIVCIVQNAFMIGNLFILLLFYSVYMKDMFNCNIFVSLVQLSVLFLFYVFGSLLHQSYLDSLKHRDDGYDPIPGNGDIYGDATIRRLHNSTRNHDVCNVNILTCIVGFVARFFMVFIAYPLNFLDADDKDSYVITFWFYNAFYGAVWGMQSEAFEVIRDNIEPKYYDSRKIDRSKVLVTAIITAILVLSVGAQWEDGYNRLWYVQGISYIFAFLLMLLLMWGNKRKRILAAKRRAQRRAQHQQQQAY